MYARGKRTKRASIDARNDRSRGRALRLFTSSCIRVALFLTAGDLYFPPEPTTFSPDWAHCPWRRSWLRVALTSRIESEPRAPVPRLFRSGHRPDSLHLYALHAPQAGRNRFCGCCRRPSVPRRCSSVLWGHSIPVICGSLLFLHSTFRVSRIDMVYSTSFRWKGWISLVSIRIWSLEILKRIF